MCIKKNICKRNAYIYIYIDIKNSTLSGAEQDWRENEVFQGPLPPASPIAPSLAGFGVPEGFPGG